MELDVLSFNGLCVVPIKCKSDVSGFVLDIVRVSYLEEIIKYSKAFNLALTYLSSSKGLVFYDDYIEKEARKFPDDALWVDRVAEQIVSQCVEFSTLNVCFMSITVDSYSTLIESLRCKGLKVTLPLVNYRVGCIGKVLSFLINNFSVIEEYDLEGYFVGS